MSDAFGGDRLPPPFPGPVPAPTLELADDPRDRLGDNVAWAWRALTGNYVRALLHAVAFVFCVVVGLAVAAAVWLGASRFEPMLPLAVLLAPVFVLIGVGVGLAVCLSLWDRLAGVVPPHRISRGSDLARLGSVVGTAALLVPLAILPFTGGAVFVALHLAMGGGLGPVAAVSEALSRCTDSARAFGRTLLVGLLLQVYAVAVWLLVWIAVPSVAVALSGTAVILPGGTAVDRGTFVGGTLAALALMVSLAVAFGFLHLVGLSTAAWTRQLGGESVAPAARSSEAWQGILVLVVAAGLCVLTGAASAFVARNAWVPDGYTPFGSGFAYRFADAQFVEEDCPTDGGCYFVEVVVKASCPKGIAVTLEETEEGRRLGSTRGTTDETDYGTVVIASLSARETKAEVTSISCR